MKRLVIFALLLAVFSANAQQINVLDKNVIKTGEQQYAHPVFNSEGNYLAFTTPGYKGLWVYNMNSGDALKVSDESGAGYKPAFDEAGKKVFYRQNQYQGFKKLSSLHAYSIGNDKHEIVQKAARDVSAPDIINGRLTYAHKGDLKKVVVDKQKAGKKSFLHARSVGERIQLTRNGKASYFAPKGEGHYLWVSLSPDQSRLLFTVAGKGSFVSDLQGNILREIGYLNAPSWLTNEFVIGMRDEDDGHRITASDIYAVSVNGSYEKNLTATEDVIEMSPSASADASKVAYHTLDGTIEVLNIEIEQ